MHKWIPTLALIAGCAAASSDFGPRAVEARNKAFQIAQRHPSHLWRDTSPYPQNAAPGVITAYIEIPAGEQNKFEYRMASNTREVDRVLHPEIGGYPVNYGMVPGTLAFDGDPLDVLVLGPPLTGGQLMDVVLVGVMDMDDEKGADPKVVASPRDEDGKPAFALTPQTQKLLQRWFNGYKRFDTAKGKWARVTGWSDPVAARALIDRCRSFFEAGR